ncbi:MAG: hypothetical protein M3Z22_08000 [Verrucomicrobiota bacterium]|nr:hypothetical protein [Verrucomicrobiota bacterium]
MGNDAPRTRPSDDSAPWRNDYRSLWVAAFIFVGLIALTAVLLETATGFISWVIFVGGMAVAWIAAVLLLIPWSTAMNVPPRRQASDSEQKSSSAADGEQTADGQGRST